MTKRAQEAAFDDVDWRQDGVGIVPEIPGSERSQAATYIREHASDPDVILQALGLS